jgi:hypothetical protein
LLDYFVKNREKAAQKCTAHRKLWVKMMHVTANNQARAQFFRVVSGIRLGGNYFFLKSSTKKKRVQKTNHC